jgi:hypothetical protein
VDHFWRSRSPWSQNNIILLVGERIFVDDFSGQYILRNALRKCIAGGFLDEAIQVPAKSAEVPIVHRIPKRYFIVGSHRLIPPIVQIKHTLNSLSILKY